MEIDAGKRFVGFHGCVSVTTLSHFGIVRTSPVENAYIVVGLDSERGSRSFILPSVVPIAGPLVAMSRPFYKKANPIKF